MMIYTRIVKSTCSFLFSAALMFFILLQSTVYAETSDDVDVTVKMSLCGDGIVEGSEQCELVNGDTTDCSNLGSYTGTSACDASCEYDLSSCTEVIPPPPEEEPEEPLPPNAPNTPHTPVPPKTDNSLDDYLKLPKNLREFDADRDGVLLEEEFATAIHVWVDAWKDFNESGGTTNPKDTCDMNNDKVCDVVDLSILLYYASESKN